MVDASDPVGLQKHLARVDYPASREDLIAAARKSRADDIILDALTTLPDRQYASPDEVNEELFHEG